jgi:predicted esterase
MRSITSCAVSVPQHARRCMAFLAVLSLSLPGVRAQNSCTAFGNPARGNVLAVIPVCGVGGTLLDGFTDAEGTPRFACLYPPSAPAAGAKYPMIVFLHPSLVNADSVKSTPLFADRDTVNISDGAVTGFIILAPQGRNTQHFYPAPDNQASGWDNWYRQMSPGNEVVAGAVFPENVDAATIDHFIQQQIATSSVDTNRIYLVGWSNGAAMSFLYGANRGNIAAAAVYSAPDPFGALEDPCQQTPVSRPPTSLQQIQLSAAGIPTFQVHNACDIAGICPNSHLIAGQLQAAGGTINLETIIDGGIVVSACDSACGTNTNGDPTNALAATIGTSNHTTWPVSQTPEMLQFLQEHPLSTRPKP